MAVMIMGIGANIDKEIAQIGALRRAVKAVEGALVRAGCLNAVIHWKKDKSSTEKDVMFLLEPTNEEGKRPYTHVGKKPDKQAEALAKVAREKHRALLEEGRLIIEHELKEAEARLSHLEYTFTSLRQKAEKLEALSHENPE